MVFKTGALRPRSRHDLSLRIFASTWNGGSAGKTAAGLGTLEAWIPTGYDLYIIVSWFCRSICNEPILFGVCHRSIDWLFRTYIHTHTHTHTHHHHHHRQGLQECATALLEDLKRSIHALLGGPAAYALFQNHVWSSNGEIALLLFARAADVASGAFEILGGLFNRVHLGVSVGAWRLPNKAAVGLACRLHGRALACVTAHFAADKHGKQRPEARVRDAVRSLKELSLGHECEEVDLQLAFHHTFVLGALRVCAEGL